MIEGRSRPPRSSRSESIQDHCGGCAQQRPASPRAPHHARRDDQPQRREVPARPGSRSSALQHRLGERVADDRRAVDAAALSTVDESSAASKLCAVERDDAPPFASALIAVNSPVPCISGQAGQQALPRALRRDAFATCSSSVSVAAPPSAALPPPPSARQRSSCSTSRPSACRWCRRCTGSSRSFGRARDVEAPGRCRRSTSSS